MDSRGRLVPWVALGLALASAVNAIATAVIVHARDYDRFTPKGAGVPIYDPQHQFAHQGIAGMTVLSCLGAAGAFAVALAWRLARRSPGPLPGRSIANGAIATAIVAAMVAVSAQIVSDWQLAPWPFG